MTALFSTKVAPASRKPGQASRLSFLSLAILLLLPLAALLLSGCASTESENLSERPWNSPKNWETGLPSGLMEGR